LQQVHSWREGNRNFNFALTKPVLHGNGMTAGNAFALAIVNQLTDCIWVRVTKHMILTPDKEEADGILPPAHNWQ